MLILEDDDDGVENGDASLRPNRGDAQGLIG
jgi:hypothetical protein